MKTLKDHVIIYDNECPMCSMYTSAFVKMSMLEKNGRMAYPHAIGLMNAHQIDHARACDEIALVNTKTGETKYGLDSLAHILTHRFPFLKGLLGLKFVHYVLKMLYSFISFNRKVIIPGKDVDAVAACRPTFNVRYRMAYLVMTWLTTSFILSHYAGALYPLIPATNFYREFLICGGQLVFQGAVILLIDRKKAMDYLGNMMTISFAAALFLALVMNFNLTPMIASGLFVLTVALMFLEHIRRVRLLKLPALMTATWMLYRIIFLILITI